MTPLLITGSFPSAAHALIKTFNGFTVTSRSKAGRRTHANLDRLDDFLLADIGLERDSAKANRDAGN